MRIVGSYGLPIRENSIPFSLEKLVVRLSPAPELKMKVSNYQDYHDSAKSGWYISFSVDNLQGRGALVVRKLTTSNIERIKKYKYLKNGAMYSVLFLGGIMLADSFGFHVPAWLSPLITLAVLAYFFYRSVKEADKKPVEVV